MAMKKCAVCGQARRKRVAATIVDGGKTRGALVCQECAGDGILLVLKRPAIKQTKTEVKGPQEVLRALKKLGKQFDLALENLPAETPLEEQKYHLGKVEGVEAAFELVESGRY